MRLPCTALALVVWATQGSAEPCVSATFDVPVPGATDVILHVTDLPSAKFPAFWQEGRLDGYPYRIFANATGLVRSDGQGQPWAIELQCDAASETCKFTPSGTPPDAATRVAERLGQCLVPAISVPEPTVAAEQGMEPTEGLAQAAADPVFENESEAEARPCGLAVVDEETEIAAMQRLLILLGEDPGPVDGFLGPKSFAAMEAFVDNPGWATSIPDLLTELSEQHCAKTR